MTAESDNLAKSLPLRSCGEDVRIYPRAHVLSPEAISIGDSVIIDDFVFLTGGTETRIGSFVHLASFSSFLGGGRLVIEDFAGVSSGSRVYTGTDDFLGESLTGPTVPDSFAGRRAPSCASDDMPWWAPTASFLPGVTIGEGCTVGALRWSIAIASRGRCTRVRRRGRSRPGGATASTSSRGTCA